MNDFVEDPAGVFSSDAHRHVLGHLSIPSDEYGWTIDALEERLRPSVRSRKDVQLLLDDLIQDGLAEYVGDAYRQSEKGYDAIKGPIANEPEPEEGAQGPAVIHRATPIPKS